MTKDSIGSSHVLITLGILFTLGGAMRFLPHSLATAAETTPVESSDMAPPVERIADPAVQTSIADRSEICFTGETAAMLKEDQSLFLTEQEELKDERLSLQARQQKLDIQAAELLALQQTLEVRWQEMQGAANGDIQHLASMYGAMKPDEAASIFNKMDPAFAAGFLRLLPSEQAGQIVASMETSKAYIVSVKLANMNNDIRNSKTTRY